MSAPRTLLSRVGPVILVALLAPGCAEILDPIEDSGTLLHVFATHHGAPQDGLFPNYGMNEQPRIFDSEAGWNVTLLESFAVITRVTLFDCQGGFKDLDMFYGPCPENLNSEDLQTVTVAGTDVPEGDFCGLNLTYGPYVPANPEDYSILHDPPENSEVEGASVFLSGFAQDSEGENRIDFELRSTQEVVVELDLTSIEGGNPMHVDFREEFPKELTVSKTYDRIFSDVDFAELDEESLEAELTTRLSNDTRITLGVVLDPSSS